MSTRKLTNQEFANRMRERRGDPAWPTPKFDFKALTQMMKDGQLYIPKPAFTPFPLMKFGDSVDLGKYRVTYNPTYNFTVNTDA